MWVGGIHDLHSLDLLLKQKAYSCHMIMKYFLQSLHFFVVLLFTAEQKQKLALCACGILVSSV